MAGTFNLKVKHAGGTTTLGDGEMKHGTNKVHKVIVIDGSGSHTVFQEQMSNASVVYTDEGNGELEWELEAQDGDVDNDIYCKLNTESSYVKKGDGLASGESCFAIYTGLTNGTQYTLSYYAVDAGGAKKDSAVQTSQLTPAAPVTKSWVLIDEYSSEPGGSPTYWITDDYAENASMAADVIEGSYPANNQTTGETAIVYDDASTWYGFEVQED